MTYQFDTYEALKAGIFASIRTLAKLREYSRKKIDALFEAYANNTQDPEKLAIQYRNISPERRKQIGFLLSVIRCLDASSKELEDKAYLLHAATFYVRERIDDSYDPNKSWMNYLASFGTTVDESNLYTLLSFSLKLSLHNVPSHEEFIMMYSRLKDFIFEHVYVDPNNLTKGYLAPEKQSFSKKKIEKFDTENFLKQLIERIAGLEKQTVDETQKTYKGSKNYRIFVPAEPGSLIMRDENDVCKNHVTTKELDDKGDHQEIILTC